MRTWSVRAMFCTGLLSALICSSPSGLYSQTTNVAPLAAYGNCPAPTHESVVICTPPAGSTISTPFQMIASATSGRSQVMLMELWVDGKKVTQAEGSPFDQPLTITPGNHRIVVIELDSTNNFVASTPLNLAVVGNDSETCSPPGAPGVNLCDPQPNSCHTNAWTTVSAAGRGNSGTVSRMELWINGVKIANFPGSQIHTNLFVADASKLAIVEVDSKGASISSPLIVVQSC